MELADVVNLSTFAINTRTRRNLVIGIGALALLASIEGYNSGISRLLRALRRFWSFRMPNPDFLSLHIVMINLVQQGCCN